MLERDGLPSFYRCEVDESLLFELGVVKSVLVAWRLVVYVARVPPCPLCGYLILS